MRTVSLRRVTFCLTLFALVFSSARIALRAQQSADQQESVADAARRAREQKKKSPKSQKVVTDDDLKPKPAATTEAAAVPPPAKGEEAVGHTKAPAAAAEHAQPVEAAAPEQAARPEVSAEDAQMAADELTKLKEDLEQAKKNLDLAQREFTLDRESHYSNPNHAGDAAGKSKVDNEERQVRELQQQMDSLKSKVAAQQEIVNKLKGSAPPPRSETKPPSM